MEPSRPSRPSAPVADPAKRTPALYRTPEEKKRLEARNGLRQFDEVCRLAEQAGGTLNLTPDLLCHFQRFAIQDIYACAGQFRRSDVVIHGSVHTPPPFSRVGWLVQEMCDTANTRSAWPPLRTASYLLWRLNWVHPFGGGNGRTSRAVAYYALCSRLGFLLPGTLTIPEQIQQDRGPYYYALDEADAADREGRLDLARMDTLLQTLLARQLLSMRDADRHTDFLTQVVEAATTPPTD